MNTFDYYLPLLPIWPLCERFQSLRVKPLLRLLIRQLAASIGSASIAKSGFHHEGSLARLILLQTISETV